jgi:transcription elongation GreA/GreB family factor
MSRAFVKEAENETAELPDRPISPHRNFVTEAGLAAIEAALGRFEAAHRAATDKGDREAAAAASREVRYWRVRRASAEVVKPLPARGQASFGTTVTLRRNDGREQSFRIVGEDEADPSRGTVSYNVAARAGRSDARSRRDGGNDRWRSHYTRRAVGERGGSGGIIV